MFSSITANLKGNMKQALPVLVLTVALIVASVALLLVRWSIAPPRAAVFDLGDPAVAASHFYGPEKSENVGFRWSKTASAISLPALSTNQVISITLNPARAIDGNPLHFRLSVGEQDLGSYEVQGGWSIYTATVGPGLSPDIRLVIDSDTFYPGAKDARRLGMAVSEVATAPREGRVGLRLPPYLWLLIAALLPVCAVLFAVRRSFYYGVIVGVGAALLTTLAALLLPANAALPIMAWVTGIVVAGLVLLNLYELLGRGAVGESPPAALDGPRWKELGAVSAFMGAIAVVFTWPLTAGIGTVMPGWPADNFAFLYKIWWFRTALTHGQWPLLDPNSYAPFGFDLAQGEPTLTNTLPGAFIGALSNDVVAYNLLILVSFVISGLGAYLLAREITRNRNAALLSAVAFAFCGYRMAQVAGHLQLTGTGWIALSFYFLERTLKTHKIRDGALLGLMLSLTALTAWYYAYMVGLALAVYAIVRIADRKSLIVSRDDRRPTTDDRQGTYDLRLTILRPLAAGAVVFLVLGGAAAIPSLRLWAQGDLTHSAKAADEHSASPLDYIVPNELQPLWGEAAMRAHADENIIETNLYLGAIAVGIAILGLVVQRRRHMPANPTGRAWLILLIVAAILSLGLTLHGPNGQVQFPFGPLLLPGKLLYDWLPFYSSMRAYARFGVVVALAMSVLMGIGWTQLLEAWQPRRGVANAGRARQLTLAALVLVMIDLWTAPYSWGTSTVAPTATGKYVASLPDPGLVMQMPLAASQSGPALFQETYYGAGKPIAYGYDTFEPIPFRDARPALQTFPGDAALDVLHDWGVRYIVVSANAYGADWPGTLEYLKTLPRLKLLQTVGEGRTWNVDPGVLDAQPEMLQYFEPDTFAVFELER
jgi:hypothetical protein